MQSRISRGPTVTLGLDDSGATPEAVRAAFLTLTKQFHPARFGRLSLDIQRMSNEVFLGIKAAHDAMLRALGASPRPGGAVPMPHSDAAAAAGGLDIGGIVNLVGGGVGGAVVMAIIGAIRNAMAK